MQAFIKSPVTRHLALLVATLMFMLGAAPRVDAAMISSMQSLDGARAQDMGTIRQALENKQVEARLSALGYSQEEIAQKL
ncbi:MAG: PA2779 family protein, partial [Desulfatibacillaceae bacterium]|nr:PA2779 family protein [Desulfatibacillaceae bacterium]